jgi:hydroxymethylpyrimidine/phosphomethylpyrimidine kinase
MPWVDSLPQGMSVPMVLDPVLMSSSGGIQAVLIKGGHMSGEDAVDLLVTRNHGLQRIPSPRLTATRRGTGCALASAIAAGIACGMSLFDACGHAKRHVLQMLSRQ